MAKPKRGGRVRDKWRDKQWIIVNAPVALGGNPINYLPVTQLESAKGRVIENTMYDILKQDPSQHQTKIYVQIYKVTAGTAYTIFKGHEYAKEFLRSLIRRGSSMIDYIQNYKTADGYEFRVDVIAFTQKRVNTSKKHDVRIAMQKVLSEKIPQMNIDEFIKQVTSGKMNDELMEECKKIVPLRHSGIKKTKLILSPDLNTLALASQTDDSAEGLDEEDNEDEQSESESEDKID